LSDVRPGAHRDADVGRHQRGGVIDAVGDDSHPPAGGGKHPHRGQLLVGEELGSNVVDAQLLADGDCNCG